MDILTGVDAIDLHKTMEEVQGGPGEPIAGRTPLGWTCAGLLQKNYPLKEHEKVYIMPKNMKPWTLCGDNFGNWIPLVLQIQMTKDHSH